MRRVLSTRIIVDLTLKHEARSPPKLPLRRVTDLVQRGSGSGLRGRACERGRFERLDATRGWDSMDYMPRATMLLNNVSPSRTLIYRYTYGSAMLTEHISRQVVVVGQRESR